MRVLAAVFAVAACSAPRPDPRTSPPEAPGRASSGDRASTDPAGGPPAGPVEARAEKLAADTARATVRGNTFVAPVGWSLRVRGTGTILESPEGGSFIALYDLPEAKDADAAVDQAWQLYKGKAPYALKGTVAGADRDGWTQIRSYDYVVSPNEQRVVTTEARFGNGAWTITILDAAEAVLAKRAAQVGLIFGKLLPRGRERESFAGKQAHPLDAARIAALRKFVEDAVQATAVPGVSFGLIQGGKVIYSGGVGVRQLGKPAKVDGDTRYMVASNTKGLATLMLAKLVDAGQATWETPATDLLPSFKLGDAETTRKVQVKHLICACTGLPRQDMEWLFQWAGVTPEAVMETLGTMEPTSEFGELFQYSNPMAAAAGFIGGHVAFPRLELGPAFDKAMQTLVFDPLGMTATTFDFAKAQRGNAAVPHAPDVDGKPALATAAVNTAIVPVRPAGGAWSSVNDMLKYVQMELAEGVLPGGKRYIGQDALLARRAPQVAVSADVTYGMGLIVNTTYGVPVVHHGGDMVGFHSDMMWLPEIGVGAVILTNADPGWIIRGQFQRKLLEVLFDGTPEADARVAANARAYFDRIAAERKLRTVPADAAAVAQLAPRYMNPVLGEITVKKRGAATLFDFGEYASEVASKQNPDGTVSFATIAPGVEHFEFVVGGAGKRTLSLLDAQHEYVFTEQRAPRAP